MSVQLEVGQQMLPLNSLLAAHKLTCGQSGQWTHRDVSCGSLYRFERGSSGEQQLLHYIPELATSYGSAPATLPAITARAPSLAEQLTEYMLLSRAVCVAAPSCTASAAGAASGTRLLVGLHQQWRSSASQHTAATVSATGLGCRTQIELIKHTISQ